LGAAKDRNSLVALRALIDSKLAAFKEAAVEEVVEEVVEEMAVEVVPEEIMSDALDDEDDGGDLVVIHEDDDELGDEAGERGDAGDVDGDTEMSDSVES
jgi:hypothetical protein